MYYQIHRKSKAFAALNEVHKRIQSAQLAVNLTLERLYNATDSTRPMGVYAGGIDLVGFRYSLQHQEQLADWKIIPSFNITHCDFYAVPPRGHHLRHEFDLLPVVYHDEVNACVGFQMQFNQGLLYQGIKVFWGLDYHLVEVPDGARYNPPRDIKEISSAKFEHLKVLQIFGKVTQYNERKEQLTAG